MPNTKGQNAASYLTNLTTLANLLSQSLVLAQQLQEDQTVNDYVTVFNNMSTYTLNADGTQGATDGSPDTAHPIVGLNVAAADISAFIGYGMNDVVSFLTGSGTPGYTDRRAAIGKLLP